MEQRELIEKYVSNDDIYLYNTGNAQRAYDAFGCRYIPECGMHRFMVWAPHAREVSVVGDFNGWDGYAHPMWKRDDETWVLFIPGLKDGDIYKYRVVGADGNTVLKADPFAFHAETGPATGSKVWSIEGYPWQDGAYMAGRGQKDAIRSPMSIYEVHMGSWRKKEGEVFPNYRGVADELAAYCKEMNYTHLPAQDLYRDAAGGRLVHEPLRAAARGREQLHPLRRGLHRALVQAREIDDVVYERDEALGLGIYLLRQKRQVLAAGQARHHHLRVAGDGGDGRLELVRDVGREVAAHVLGDG